MIEIFCTDVQQEEDAQKIILILSVQFPLLKVNFDLDDCDKILRVEGSVILSDKITEVLNENEFTCKIIV